MYPSRLLLDPQRATYQATSFFFLPFSRIRILLSIKNSSDKYKIMKKILFEIYVLLGNQMTFNYWLVQSLYPAPFPRNIGILPVRHRPVEKTPEMVVTFKVIARVAHWRIIGEQNVSLKPLTAVNFR